MQILTIFLLAVLGVAAPVTPRQPNKQTTRQPNVIIILADDLGYCDTGLYGCREIPTPNIDSIAKAGVKFTRRAAKRRR